MLVGWIRTGVAAAALALALASCGGDGGAAPARDKPAPTKSPRRAAGPLTANAQAEFARFERQAGGKVGLAVAPLGRGDVQLVGSVATGRAWSTIKVPIVLAATRAAGSIDPFDADAKAALQRSDNAAAQRIFDRLGDLDAASAEVEAWLREAGDDQTRISTSTPPPGLSTFGQTRWSAVESATFMRSLARGCLADPDDTDAILSLMRKPASNQRWGAGGLGAPAAYKGGWGPEDDGGYLVRQIALIGEGDQAWVASAIARPDDRGGRSFAAGRELVSGALAWAADHLRAEALGPPERC